MGKTFEHTFWEGSEHLKFKIVFAGADRDKLVADMKGTPMLMSWMNERKGIIRYIEAGHKIFVDCGAYTAHTRGKEVDMESYIDFVNTYDHGIEIFASVDKIPGVYGKPKSKAELDEAPEITWNNYLYIREKVKSWHKALPIFHQGEDFKYLEQMLETTFDGYHIPYIGISPANDVATSLKEPWIAKCFDYIKKSSNPDVKTHAFGMTSLNLLEKFPFTSADSMSWLFLARNGKLMTKFGAIIISKDVKKDFKQAIHYKHRDNEEIMKAFESEFLKKGFTLEELQTSAERRTHWNIHYLLDWAKQYEHKPVKKQRRLF